VRLAKIRWRIEHDYRELKTGLGLDHFEGRSWTGWHHHITLRLTDPKARGQGWPSTASCANSNAHWLIRSAPAHNATTPSQRNKVLLDVRSLWCRRRVSAGDRLAKPMLRCGPGGVDAVGEAALLGALFVPAIRPGRPPLAARALITFGKTAGPGSVSSPSRATKSPRE
jgi:hypothetical protein